MLLWIRKNGNYCKLNTENIKNLNDIKILEKKYNTNILKEIKQQGEQNIKKWSITGIIFFLIFVFLFLLLDNNKQILFLPIVGIIFAMITYHNWYITNEIERIENIKNNCLLLE